ncbi:GAF domain-containing protein [Pseudonocardia ailaonensis]|uniref:GAF domain-containing protein n=1 Tax=Pseudonocardia ailaonensis TaxID=367279 RepID=UPI0031D9EC69
MTVERSVVVSPRLSASWRRSRDYGAPVDAVDPVFAGGVDDESLYFRCGHEVLRGLKEALSGEPVSMMLTDADGLVLSRMCDEPALTRALDATHLAPGFAFSEREAGTNGLGLALADRAPSLVRGSEHYCTGLWGYTCAAAPVIDPVHHRLLGSVNLTTWTHRSDALLLALARTAAAHISALVTGHGTVPQRTPRGEVFRVVPAGRYGPDAVGAGKSWDDALATVVDAVRTGRTAGVVGEPGVGKTALLRTALREAGRDRRILEARPPDQRDLEPWLALWVPELRKGWAEVIVGGVDALPLWAAAELARIVSGAPGVSLAVTASDVAAVPDPLVSLLDVVVELPPLRLRPDGISPLAEHLGRCARGTDVRFTPAAARALAAFTWPGNVGQLRRVVSDAVLKSDVVDSGHLAPEVLCGPGRVLTRLETLERDEIARALAQPGVTVAQAAESLGMSRATVYRRISRYGIRPGPAGEAGPRRGPARPLLRG